MACSERVVRKFNIVNLHKEDSPGIDLKVVLYVPQGPSANCCTNRKKSDEEPKIEIQERTFSVMVDALDRSNNMVTYKTVFELQEPLALQPKKSTYEVKQDRWNRTVITLFLKSSEPMGLNWRSCVKKKF
ncbi:uncharacterized protein LOC135488687 [Lineus longissimus]|uniref:uncharacterized protein LOC135488687 n=1 Tax=Lineus longissimus TaxID=88925 RepID=UPI002B4E06FE